jgi:ParB-like chromosome segregation protein Spo0J
MTKQAMQIDTQQVVEKLTGAGVPHRQARAHASVLSDALQDVDLRFHDQFITRQDLAEALAPIHEALTRLEVRINALDAKIDSKIDASMAKNRADVARWIFTSGLFQTGIITALMLEIVN